MHHAWMWLVQPNVSLHQSIPPFICCFFLLFLLLHLLLTSFLNSMLYYGCILPFLWNKVSTLLMSSILGEAGQVKESLVYTYFPLGLYVPIGMALVCRISLHSYRCLCSLKGTLTKFCYPFFFSRSFSPLSLTFLQYFLSPLFCPLSSLPLPYPSHP